MTASNEHDVSIASSLGLRRLRRMDETESTNTVALGWSRELAREDLPALVVASRQTAGRGRGANRWWSGEGALTFSLVIEPAAYGVVAAQWPALSLTVGAAVATAMLPLLPRCDLRVKWPNDVYLDGRKLAGILIEAPPEDSTRLVIGIGVNVNNTFAAAPDDVRARGASACEAAGVVFDLDEILQRILQQLCTDFEALGRSDPDLAARWRRLCLLSGRIVIINDNGRMTAGACLGIDDDGALRVQTEFSLERLFSGVVVEYV